MGEDARLVNSLRCGGVVAMTELDGDDDKTTISERVMIA